MCRVHKPRNRIPEAFRRELITARKARHWTQSKLGQLAGLPQMHISGIETGKIAPRFDTLLDLVRILEFDLLLVPRSLVPSVQALVRDHRHPSGSNADQDERPLYAVDLQPENGDES